MIERILGVNFKAHGHGSRPQWRVGAHPRQQLLGMRCVFRTILALRINLEQLHQDFGALRVLRHRLLKDLLGLHITAIGNVDVGFSHRIDLIHVRFRHRVIKLGGKAAGGIDQGTGLVGSHRIDSHRLWRTGGRREECLGAVTTTAHGAQPQPGDQRGAQQAATHRQRVVRQLPQQVIQERRLGLDRYRLGRCPGFKIGRRRCGRLGRIRQGRHGRSRLVFGHLDGRLDRLGVWRLGVWRLGVWHLGVWHLAFRRLAFRRRGFGCLDRWRLEIGRRRVHRLGVSKLFGGLLIQQLAHLLDVTLQRSGTVLGFTQTVFLCHGLVVRPYLGFVGCGLAFGKPLVVTLGRAARNLQHIVATRLGRGGVLGLCTQAASDRRLGGRGLRGLAGRGIGQALAVAFKIGGQQVDAVAGFLGLHRGGFLAGGQMDLLASADAMDAVVDERAAIGFEHGQHGLLERNRRGAVGDGQGGKRITRLDGVILAGVGGTGRCLAATRIAGAGIGIGATNAGLACCDRRRGCRRCSVASCARRPAACRRRRCSYRRLDWHFGRCGIGAHWIVAERLVSQIAGRVEQQGIVAQQPTGGPVHFDQQVERRLGNRLGAGHADVGLSASTLFNRKAHTAKCRRVLDIGFAERVLGGQSHRHALQVFRGDVEQIDLCRQRLSQGTVDVDTAKAGGRGQFGNQGQAHCQNPGFKCAVHSVLHQVLIVLLRDRKGMLPA